MLKLSCIFSLAMCLALSYLAFFLFDEQTIIILTREDGLVENLGAFTFLIASIFFLINFLNSKFNNRSSSLKNGRNIFFLLLAITLFFGFGEEISWGQRIFNFQTPDAIKRITDFQQEFNVHNLLIFQLIDDSGEEKDKWLTCSRLFSLFCLFYLILLPSLNKFFKTFSRLINKINLPIVPLSLGIFFIINYLIAKIIELYILEHLIQYLTEIKEFNYGLLFMVISMYFLRNRNEVQISKSK